MLDKKFWEKYFEVYDVLNELIPYQELMQNIVDALDVKKGDRILDAGSGTGNLSMKLEELGACVVAFDFSEEGQRIHKKKNPRQTEFVLGDLTKNLSFENESFDKIVSNNTLYTIPKDRRESVIKDFNRILKPDGKIVLSNPAKEFKSTTVYFDHLKKDIKKSGLLKTLFKVLKYIFPTIKMFFYNHKIKKEDKRSLCELFEKNETKTLLERGGFVNASNGILVYSGQSFLNYAYKDYKV